MVLLLSEFCYSRRLILAAAVYRLASFLAALSFVMIFISTLIAFSKDFPENRRRTSCPY